MKKKHLHPPEQRPAPSFMTITGLDVHVYSVEDAIVDTNAETGSAVGVDGVAMDVVVQAEANDATPTNLRRVIEAGSHHHAHHPAIVRCLAIGLQRDYFSLFGWLVAARWRLHPPDITVGFSLTHYH